MFALMRHCRFLRKLLPQWHKREREIAVQIRQTLLGGRVLSGVELRQLDNVKGYRDWRYGMFCTRHMLFLYTLARIYYGDKKDTRNVN